MYLSVLKKTSRYTIPLLIASFIFVSHPKQASAGIVWDPGNNVPNVVQAVAGTSLSVKELALDTAAYFVVNQMIRRITAQTVNWINSGFQGNPAFITDPGRFFLDVADREAGRFISSTNLNNLCSPFRASIRISLVRNHLSETDNSIQSCTIGGIVDNFDNFMQDFSQGGWDGWLELTQIDQNNPYGAYLDAKNKMEIQIGTQTQKYQKQLEWGSGFLSFERCVGGETFDSSTGRNECYGNRETVTPGSVIEGQLNGVLGSGNNRLEVADEINEMIVGLLGQLTNSLFGGISGGLRSLSGGGSGNTAGRSFTTDLESETDSGASNTRYLNCVYDTNGVPDCSLNVPPPPPPPPIPPCPADLGYPCDYSNTGGVNPGPAPVPGCVAPYASQEQIDAWLIANPGDAHRLAEAFPCP